MCNVDKSRRADAVWQWEIFQVVGKGGEAKKDNERREGREFLGTVEARMRTDEQRPIEETIEPRFLEPAIVCTRMPERI